MATERLQRVADAINKGASAHDALIDAGYGEKFAAGHAAGIPSLLEKQGLLRQGKAANVKSGAPEKAAPAPAREDG